MKCIICNKRFTFYYSTLLVRFYLGCHIEQAHPHIIKEIKEQFKLTWLSRYFTFNISPSSIRCIFCEDDIRVLKGINNLQHHMLCHNIHEYTITFFKVDDITMQLSLPKEIYEKIIQKLRDEFTSTELSLYFIFDTLRYGYTMIKCAMCDLVVNILFEKQILKDHLFNCHNISK